jgi:L-2-hydroxyglutarate oxidase LhgO
LMALPQRNDTQQAAEAVAAAFLLNGGGDLALAVARQLGAMLDSVGCTDTLSGVLEAAGEAAIVEAKQAGMPGIPSFGLAAAQLPSLAACWMVGGRALAQQTLAALSPTIAADSGEQRGFEWPSRESTCAACMLAEYLATSPG